MADRQIRLHLGSSLFILMQFLIDSKTAKAYADYASRSITERPSDKISVFNNPNFGEVRIIMDDNGEPLFCLADVCRVLELTNPTTVKNRLDKCDIQLVDLHALNSTEGGMTGNSIANFITESGFYDVVLQSSSPRVKPFRKWVTSEVLPSIRKTGGYTLTVPRTYSEALRQLADEVEAKEKAQMLLSEKTEQLDESMEWFSIKRWAKLHRKNWRNYSWRKLKAVSHELGYEVKKIFDGNYDEVNIYHRAVFEAVYGK